MTAAEPISSDGVTVHPGDSSAQRAAEPLMIDAVALAIGVPLTKQAVQFADDGWCEVDGVSEDGLVLAEAFAHQGTTRGGQVKKVSDDALKLVTIAKNRPDARLIIAFADDLAAKAFLGRSWRAEALRMWGVEVLVVDLAGEVRDGLRTAQVRQFR